MPRQNLFGSHICDGFAGAPAKIAMVQVWNPPANTNNFAIEVVRVSWLAVASVQTALSNICGWDYDFDTSPLGNNADARYLMDKNAGNTVLSPIQLRIFQAAVPYPAGRLNMEQWINPMGVTQPFVFSSPVILPPGNGMQVRIAQPNVYNIVDIEGYMDLPAAAPVGFMPEEVRVQNDKGYLASKEKIRNIRKN